MLENIGDNPQAINDTDFRRKLNEVADSVDQLLEDAKQASGIFDHVTPFIGQECLK